MVTTAWFNLIWANFYLTAIIHAYEVRSKTVVVALAPPLQIHCANLIIK